MTKVFIAPGDSYNAAITMFERAGFTVVKDYQEVDLICFLGGTDVDPDTYGAIRDPHTQLPDKKRDEIEVKLYKKFIDTPKVGICRGGQLLNVLNGGKMIQHLGYCVSGDVEATTANDGPVVLRVDHHQGIVVSHEAIPETFMYLADMRLDYAGYYPKTKSLFFQAHPEWSHQSTEDYFFELIERYFGFVRKDNACAA